MTGGASPGDLMLKSFAEVIRLQEINKHIKIGEEDYVINSEEFSIGGGKDFGEYLNYEIYVDRDTEPKEPSLRQLISAIGYGDDRFYNSLVLNIYGFFELRDHTICMPKIIDPTIAVRYETFGVGNEYVGSSPALSEAFTDEVYESMISKWRLHLKTGMTNLYFE